MHMKPRRPFPVVHRVVLLLAGCATDDYANVRESLLCLETAYSVHLQISVSFCVLSPEISSFRYYMKIYQPQRVRIHSLLHRTKFKFKRRSLNLFTSL